jgi:hypothetical protein
MSLISAGSISLDSTFKKYEGKVLYLQLLNSTNICKALYIHYNFVLLYVEQLK